MADRVAVITDIHANLPALDRIEGLGIVAGRQVITEAEQCVGACLRLRERIDCHFLA